MPSSIPLRATPSMGLWWISNNGIVYCALSPHSRQTQTPHKNIERVLLYHTSSPPVYRGNRHVHRGNRHVYRGNRHGFCSSRSLHTFQEQNNQSLARVPVQLAPTPLNPRGATILGMATNVSTRRCPQASCSRHTEHS